ncbi:MAG: FAD-dependent pyridine nucleotide-disulfide oxidoreductase [uncultured bacterium]|nr:MAG: FAD-dependent pyridine nucleotide-disulfide oxidoreductase [uncultured bacterium]
MPDYLTNTIGVFRFMEDLQKQIDELKKTVSMLQKNSAKDKISMVVFSGDLDKILASFVIATGAAAMGTEVSMFFTFWGTAALRDPKKQVKGKNLISKMFGIMLPCGFDKTVLSKMHMGGMGTGMMKWLMKKKKIASVSEMLKIAEESDVKITICEMSMDLMGMKRDEMIDYNNLQYAGVAKFMEDSLESKTTLFI